MYGSDLFCKLKLKELINLDNMVKFNYTLEVSFNESFKKAYDEYITDKGKEGEGLKVYLLEDFLLDYFKDVLDGVRKNHPEFNGKFILGVKHDIVKGVFKSDTMMPGSLDEPLRRDFFEGFKTLINRDDLRVDINLGCMI